MTEHDELYDKVKRFLDKNYPCCGVTGCCGEEEEAAEIVRLVVASGYMKQAAS